MSQRLPFRKTALAAAATTTPTPVKVSTAATATCTIARRIGTRWNNELMAWTMLWKKLDSHE